MSDCRQKESQTKGRDKVLTTRVHGYKQIVVSDLLKDRHPYIDQSKSSGQLDSRLSNQLKSEKDVKKPPPPEVFKAVWFRAVPNLVNVLTHADSTPAAFHEALLILNEMASVQEQKISMINAGLVEVAFGLLEVESKSVQTEALSLLGSLLSIREGRKRLSSISLRHSMGLLRHSDRAIREAMGWMLGRLTSARDGVKSLIVQDMVEPVLASFSSLFDGEIKPEDALHLLLMLETLAELMNDEEAHPFFAKRQIVSRLANILRQLQASPRQWGSRSPDIMLKSLECLSLLSIFDDLRAEIIESDVVERVAHFLEHELVATQNYCLRILMFVAISPAGRAQVIDSSSHGLLRQIKRLSSAGSKEVRENCEELVLTLSEDVRRFRKIYDALETA